MRVWPGMVGKSHDPKVWFNAIAAILAAIKLWQLRQMPPHDGELMGRAVPGPSASFMLPGE